MAMRSSNVGGDGSFVFTGTEELLCADLMHNYNRGITAVFKNGWLLASSGERVLDFGAGIGSITAAFLVETGVKPVALEIDKALSDILRSRGFTVIHALTELPLATLDLVFSSNVLEHIENDVATIQQVFSVLRPGGVFALYVPAFPVLYTAHDKRVGHVRRYTRKELTSKLAAEGFVVFESSYRDCLGFFATLAYKLFRGGKGQSPSLRQLRAYDRMYVVSSLLDHSGARHLFGKNLAVIARKPDAQASGLSG